MNHRDTEAQRLERSSSRLSALVVKTKKMVENDLLTEKIIGAAIEVHRVVGPGLLESACEGASATNLFEGNRLHAPAAAAGGLQGHPSGLRVPAGCRGGKPSSCRAKDR